MKALWRTICRIIRSLLTEKEESSWKVWLFLKTYALLTPVYLSDNKYEILSKDELEQIVNKVYEEVKNELGEYKAETIDCDNWSLLFYAYAKIKSIRAIGLVWNGCHAFNIAIAYDGEIADLFVIEPQQKKIYKYEEAIEMELYAPRWRFILM